MNESDFIARLRAIASDPGARGLADDAAVLAAPGDLVLTHDMLVEGVHYLAADPPEDVAWKLVAVNLSDLAAKGARPRGVLLGHSLLGDGDWDARFADGLGRALEAMAAPLLGGDTVAYRGGPRVLSLTALGDAPPGGAPSRSGARAGDDIWVSGAIGDGGAGLTIAKRLAGDPAGLAIARGTDGPAALLDRYRRPTPRIALGRALAPHVGAMMDVSDGLLIDCKRMCAASGAAADLDLDRVPISAALLAHAGEDRSARLAAATAGDDYELLFAAPAASAHAIEAAAGGAGVPVTPIGRMREGEGVHLSDAAGAVPLPARLGYEHGVA
uniref:thiamine-phosphate kinase n=1 Tax=uncultured Sphingomonas sp. TaxID=158754 RepID=UPI0025E99E2D|nr:thiamine-phosphate kinase [uncultured Sphingomonas sp.]